MAKPLPKAQPPSARNRLRAARPLASLHAAAAQADRTIDNEETRGGCRGGRAAFSWDTVKSDKHRNMYLGNSLKANVWRSARPSDWYTKSTIADDDEVAVEEEKSRVKREEELTAKIVSRFGMGALADLEKYKQLLGREEEKQQQASQRPSNTVKVTKSTNSIMDELRRERQRANKK